MPEVKLTEVKGYTSQVVHLMVIFVVLVDIVHWIFVVRVDKIKPLPTPKV
jgi:hypothetical protein